jgi:hypothetical protein
VNVANQLGIDQPPTDEDLHRLLDRALEAKALGDVPTRQLLGGMLRGAALDLHPDERAAAEEVSPDVEAFLERATEIGRRHGIPGL